MTEITNPLLTRLERKSYELRKTILEMCIRAGTGHVTSSFSCVDILVALFYGDVMRLDPENPEWEERDRFILSKGQASPALYAILADLGFFDRGELDSFAQKGGMFGVHLQYDVPGVEITSGSLGHGFGVAAGIALGLNMDRRLPLVFALLGDGECHEGSIWETAMFASHNNLNNLIAIVDRNYMCATGFTENIVSVEPLEDKWKSFGWEVVCIDGHSYRDILDTLRRVRCRKSIQPLVIIAETVKGEGIDFISNVPLWHAVAPKGEDIERARKELERRYGYEQ